MSKWNDGVGQGQADLSGLHREVVRSGSRTDEVAAISDACCVDAGAVAAAVTDD